MSTPQAIARRARLNKLLADYGLVLILILITAAFSIAIPGSFLTGFTWQSILQNNYIVAIMALAETVCIACGEFDLSIGYNLGLLHLLAIGIIVNQDISWYLACLIILVLGCVIGLVSGLLVYFWKINSFIVTLGVGTITTGLAYVYSGGIQVNGVSFLPQGFIDLAGTSLGGIPLPIVILIVLVVILAGVMELTPAGRCIYALGANRRASVLAGIRPGRYVIGVFVCSGFLTAIASLLYASRTQIGDVTVGAPYLLPVFTAAILGSSVIRPGRPNVIGTIVAVALLGIALAGLLTLGGATYVQDIFNGVALIGGVGFAGVATRRATSAQLQAHENPTAPTVEQEPPIAVAIRNGADRARAGTH